MKAQADLIETEPEPEGWREEWKGMPEFEQKDLTSHRKIVVHFRSDEDVDAFAELMNQKITAKQKALWYPEMQPRRYGHLVYVKEDE